MPELVLPSVTATAVSPESSLVDVVHSRKPSFDKPVMGEHEGGGERGRKVSGYNHLVIIVRTLLWGGEWGGGGVREACGGNLLVAI